MEGVGVENLCPDFCGFWERARDLDPDDRKRLWREVYEDRHRAVFDVYFGHFGSRGELDRALARFPAVADRVRATASRLERAAADVVSACAGLFGAPDEAVPVVVFVGLFCSDAWVWPLRGEWTAFFAAEMLAYTRPRRLRISVAHEAAHALHVRCAGLLGADALVAVRSAGLEAFAEGVAVVASEQLVPGAGEAAYLNLGANSRTWVAGCRRSWPALRRAFLDQLEQTDPAVLAAYFHADPAPPPPGMPVRAGYFLGYRVVEALSRRHTVAEMARWPVRRAVAEFGHALEEMTGP